MHTDMSSSPVTIMLSIVPRVDNYWFGCGVLEVAVAAILVVGWGFGDVVRPSKPVVAVAREPVVRRLPAVVALIDVCILTCGPHVE